MHEADAINIARHAITVALQITTPILLLILAVGVIVSLFQALTQIQEQTLTFVPKILVLVGGLLLFGPWMLHLMVGFTTDAFNSLPGIVR